MTIINLVNLLFLAVLENKNNKFQSDTEKIADMAISLILKEFS